MAGGIDWLRWHHGSVTDPKFQLVARKAGCGLADVIGVWAFVLEKASASEVRGTFGELDVEAIDCLFAFDDGTTEAILLHMDARGLLDGGSVAAWEKRQPKRERTDDNSTERTKAFRDRKRQGTPGNAEEHHGTPRGEERREEENTPSIEGVPRATPGEACKAMKAAGMQSVNPSDPRLVSLLNDGMTIEELVVAAGEAVERGKPFAYALATAEGRRQDAAARRPLPAKAKGGTEPITFAEQERRAGMQRWEEMTGQRHPGLDKLRNAGEVIDALPNTTGPRIEHVAAH